ncbi:MAG TPA: glycerophosphodiester phosphodiesterase family protein [Actinomycetota bacterium]
MTNSELPRILGHRGARFTAPENTVASFQAAIAEGADGVELDLRRTLDQALVCLHDPGLGRTTDGRGPVRQWTLEELRRLDASAGLKFGRNGSAGLPWTASPGSPGSPARSAGDWPFRGIQIPTIAQALDALPRSALVDVEAKFRGEGPDGPAEVAELLAAELAGRPDRDRIMVSSFSRRLMAAAVPKLPGMRVGIVTSALTPLGRALRVAEAAGCTLLAAQAHAYLGPMAKAAASRAADAGILLLAWTVDDPETALRLADLGVSVIVSDRPGALRQALAQSP